MMFTYTDFIRKWNPSYGVLKKKKEIQGGA